MSFNLNNLVQPECGGSNPLVLAAHQITSKPPPLSSLSSASRQAPMNLASEFMRQQQQVDSSNSVQSGSRGFARNSYNQILSGRQNAQPNNQVTSNVGKLAKDFLSEHELSDKINRQLSISSNKTNDDHHLIAHQNLAPQSMMSHLMGSAFLSHQTSTLNKDSFTSESAADQLEEKYRNDMISQQNSTTDRQDADLTNKVDDIEFWQTLSQRYIGPSTIDNMAKLRSETVNTQKTSMNDATITDSLKESLLEDAEYPLFDENPPENLELESVPASAEEYVFDERNPLKDKFENPFEEGLKRLELGDIPSAALLFEAAVQLDPQNALAWRYLGTTQAQNEKDSSAISALHNCLKYDPSDQQARLAIAVSLTNEHYYCMACIHLLEWLERHEVYKAVGASTEVYRNLEKEGGEEPFYTKAANYVRDKFVEAARMSPNNPDPEVQSSLGVLFNMNGEYEKAVDCFKAALSVRADDSLLWNRLGATLANGNKSDEAVIAYRKALQISPGFLRSRYNLAITLINLNTYDESAKQLVQVLNMQAAGQGSKNVQIRTRSITSTAVWNTLRLVSTLINKPELYPIIDGRDLPRLNEEIFGPGGQSALRTD